MFSEEVLLGRLKNSQTLQNLEVLVDHLDSEKRGELVALIRNYPVLFSDTPSQTHLIEHDIDIGDAKPIKQRFYRVSEEKRLQLETEVQYMWTMVLLSHVVQIGLHPVFWSKSLIPLSDPALIIEKLTMLLKQTFTLFLGWRTALIKLGQQSMLANLIFKGILASTSYQRACEIAAFITSSGLFSYTVMPFGLRNAPATFQRLMNRVVSGLEGCAVYLDDVVVYSDSWEEHVRRVRALFERLVWARLTVNLAKCEFAKATVTYLGKVVGQGFVCPVEAKVQAVKHFPQPSTKKELMRFLGMAGVLPCFPVKTFR